MNFSLKRLIMLPRFKILQKDSAARRRDRPVLQGKTMRNGKSHQDDFHVDESRRLEEAKETALLEVFVAAIRIAKEESTGGKKVSNSVRDSRIPCDFIASVQGKEEMSLMI